MAPKRNILIVNWITIHRIPKKKNYEHEDSYRYAQKF